MVEQLKAKKVPWSQLEKYLKIHQAGIVAYVDQLELKLSDIPEIEGKLPRSFMQLHEVITQILKDNDILPI